MPVVIVWDFNPALRYAPDFMPDRSRPDMFTRLYILRRYYPAVAMLKKYPLIRFTFNISADIARDINMYDSGRQDRLMELSLKPPEFMSRQEKEELLSLCKFAGRFVNLNRYPGFRRLYEKWLTDEQLTAVAKNIRNRDLRDLQTWVNLSWIADDFLMGARYLGIADGDRLYQLVTRGKNFSEEEKNFVVDFHRRALLAFPELIKTLVDDGQVEITFSQSENAILPLIFNLERIGRAPSPAESKQTAKAGVKDGLSILRKSQALIEKVFGVSVTGFYPSFSAFSPSLLTACSAIGIDYMILSESVLAANLESNRNGVLSERNRDALYQPAKINAETEKAINVLFYDAGISGKVLNSYPGSDEESAAENLLRMLLRVYRNYGYSEKHSLLTVYLEGDDIYNLYPGDGKIFQRKLLELLSRTDEIKTVCPGIYFIKNKPKKQLSLSRPATVYEDNFQTWLGEDEEFQAWKRLREAREILEKYSSSGGNAKRISLAENWIYCAENELWYRWFGKDYDSGIDAEIDKSFNRIIKKIYTICRENAPSELRRSIIHKEPMNISEKSTWLFQKAFSPEVTNPELLYRGEETDFFNPYNRIKSVQVVTDRDKLYLHINTNNPAGNNRFFIEYRGEQAEPEKLALNNTVELVVPVSLFDTVFPDTKLILSRGHYPLHAVDLSLKINPSGVGKLLVDIPDPAGDDYGAGSVVYPLMWDKKKNSLDLLGCQIYETSDSYVFEIRLMDNSGTVHLPDPFSIDVYLDYQLGGSRELLPGRQAVFDQEDWDGAVVYNGSQFFWITPNLKGTPVVEKSLRGTRYPGGLIVEVPRELIGADVDLRSIFVATVPGDISDSSPVKTVAVNSLPDKRHFGGGDDSDWDSNIIDLIGEDQDLTLASWEPGQYCHLRMIPVMLYRQNSNLTIP